MENNLIKVKTAAKILGCKIPKIYALIENGTFTNYGSIYHTRLDPNEIMDYHLSHSEKTKSIYNDMILDFDESLKPLEAIHNQNSRLKPLKFAKTTTKYAISNKGRVFNLAKCSEIVQSESSHGYLQVAINSVSERVHVLVAFLWCPNSRAVSEVHHIDNDRQNNNCNNLIWVSAAEHDNLHALMKQAGISGDYTEYNKEVERIRKLNEYDEELRCLLYPKEHSVIAVWVTKQAYLDYKAGKIDEIDYTKMKYIDTIVTVDRDTLTKKLQKGGSNAE